MAKTKDVYEVDELTAYYNDIYAMIDSTSMGDSYGNYVLKRVKGGKKTVFNKTQTETRDFDMSFLDVIESTYPAIIKIMRNPYRSIRYDEDLVAVEKARKVNSTTVRHLSSHTQLIKEITKEGDVIPSKVLTTFAEEELAIYENRFIKSLVKRIEMFLERRYEVMKITLESLETQRLSVNNEFLMSGQQVNVNLDISITNRLDTDVKTTKEQYNRLLYVKEMIHGLHGTEFMRALSKAKEILPPIMKTNMILHNPDFRMCYELWVYLDKVDTLSTNVDIKEQSFRYTSKFDSDISAVMALAVTSFIKNRNVSDIYVTKNLPSKKAPKVAENNEIELEMELEAENKQMEDYSMNQLLLEQTAEFYEAAFQGIREGKITFHESVKTVYKQMLDMLDQIYPKAFGVPDLKLQSQDVYEELEFARRKLAVNKIVRAQKQANLLKMSKEQKAIEKEIAEIERRVQAYEAEERIRLEELHKKEEKRLLAQLERERKEAELLRKQQEEAQLQRQQEETNTPVEETKTVDLVVETTEVELDNSTNSETEVVVEETEVQTVDVDLEEQENVVVEQNLSPEEELVVVENQTNEEIEEPSSVVTGE